MAWTGPRAALRSATFFTGLEVIEPGLVPLDHWRPDVRDVPGNGAGGGAHDELPSLCGVARKPG